MCASSRTPVPARSLPPAAGRQARRHRDRLARRRGDADYAELSIRSSRLRESSGAEGGARIHVNARWTKRLRGGLAAMRLCDCCPAAGVAVGAGSGFRKDIGPDCPRVCVANSAARVQRRFAPACNDSGGQSSGHDRSELGCGRAAHDLHKGLLPCGGARTGGSNWRTIVRC
jgi:hypothetical protein